MKIIALIAVMAMLLLSLAMPNSSVGGPLTIMLILFLVMLAVGISEAWSKKRGVLGWIVNIVVAVIGGFVAAISPAWLLRRYSRTCTWKGSLASSQHPLLYVLSAAMAILTVLGSWIPLQIVNRFR